MSDGHSGIENNQVNEGGSGNFGFVLSYLKEGSGQTAFVLHATSKSYLYRETLRFLSDIGLSHFEGHCSFDDEKCFYSIVAEARRDAYGDVDEQQVENIHEAFSRFAGNIDGIFQLRKVLV